jgi:hypothetical protein
VSGRCYTITLPDGSHAIVRAGKRGWKPSPAELELIVKAKEALNTRCPACKRAGTIVEGHCEICGWEAECNHEDDGEGTCLGCGAQL